jgi:hypothetical protein
MVANDPASHQTGFCWRFLFNLTFSGLGAMSIHARFSRPFADSYCFGQWSFNPDLYQRPVNLIYHLCPTYDKAKDTNAVDLQLSYLYNLSA